jgi:hypothetical protein
MEETEREEVGDVRLVTWKRKLFLEKTRASRERWNLLTEGDGQNDETAAGSRGA